MRAEKSTLSCSIGDPSPRCVTPTILPLSLLAALAVVLLLQALEMPPGVIAGAGMMIPLLAARLTHSRATAIGRSLREHGGFVCAGCGFGLSGLPGAGRCPGCAKSYVRTSLEAAWRWWEESLRGGRRTQGGADFRHDPIA